LLQGSHPAFEAEFGGGVGRGVLECDQPGAGGDGDDMPERWCRMTGRTAGVTFIGPSRLVASFRSTCSRCRAHTQTGQRCCRLGRGHRRALRLAPYHALPDPPAGPPPSAVPAPRGCPRPGGQWNAGFRGAVSLAAALAVPDAIVSGMPFPDRDMIIFVRPELSLSPWCFRGCSCRPWCAGLGCPVTPPSSRNAT
jgi:hypothetical protein